MDTIRVGQDRDSRKNKWQVLVNGIRRGVLLQSPEAADNLAVVVQAKEMPHAELILSKETELS